MINKKSTEWGRSIHKWENALAAEVSDRLGLVVKSEQYKVRRSVRYRFTFIGDKAGSGLVMFNKLRGQLSKARQQFYNEMPDGGRNNDMADGYILEIIRQLSKQR